MSINTKKDSCVSLRGASAADLPTVLDLLRKSGLPTDGVTAGALPEFVVAESGGKLVGVVGLEVYRESALLRSAAVDERWRGSGVGKALVDRALAISRERGIHEVFLLTTTAEQYFPRFGFNCICRDKVPEPVRASAEFQDACPASAVVMRKAM